MLKIFTMPLGAYQTNCYLVWQEGCKECLVIDPGCEAQTIAAQAEKRGLEIAGVLLTHGHFDHVGAVKDLAAETQCRVYLCPEDLSMPPAMTAGALYRTDDLHEGTQLHLAGLDITVLHTPGHTPGSVCFAVEDVLFSGDTLFAGSCGRTDLPGGDWNAITKSLHRLSELTTDYWVLPGHGESTTLSEEKRYNPYMR